MATRNSSNSSKKPIQKAVKEKPKKPTTKKPGNKPARSNVSSTRISMLMKAEFDGVATDTSLGAKSPLGATNLPNGFAEIVHSAFYRVTRMSTVLPLPQFVAATVGATMPKGSSPTGWPGFWWESVAVEIQNAFLARRLYIRNWNAAALSGASGQTWGNVIVKIHGNLIQLP